MQLLDEESQKWYCQKDDELYYAKENHWGALPEPNAPTFGTKGDVLGGYISGGVIGAAIAIQQKKKAEKNAPMRETLLNKLISDTQYEEAFKQWWTQTFPKKRYDRETFVNWTKKYVNEDLITLENDEVKFSGAERLLANCIVQDKKNSLRSRKQSKLIQRRQDQASCSALSAVRSYRQVRSSAMAAEPNKHSVNRQLHVESPLSD